MITPKIPSSHLKTPYRTPYRNFIEPPWTTSKSAANTANLKTPLPGSDSIFRQNSTKSDTKTLSKKSKKYKEN